MNLLKIKKFFAEKYPDAINTKSRKREVVMQRRMIINFLFQEGKIRASVMKNIIGGTHQVICFFLRNVNDKTFEDYYKTETEKFRSIYWELVGSLPPNGKQKDFCESKKRTARKGAFDLRNYAIAMTNRRKKKNRDKLY